MTVMRNAAAPAAAPVIERRALRAYRSVSARRAPSVTNEPAKARRSRVITRGRVSYPVWDVGCSERGREASQPGREPSVVHPLAAVAGRLSVSGWTAIGLQTGNQDRYGGAVSVLVPIDLGQRVSDMSPRRCSPSAVTRCPPVNASQQFTRLR